MWADDGQRFLSGLLDCGATHAKRAEGLTTSIAEQTFMDPSCRRARRLIEILNSSAACRRFTLANSVGLPGARFQFLRSRSGGFTCAPRPPDQLSKTRVSGHRSGPMPEYDTTSPLARITPKICSTASVSRLHATQTCALIAAREDFPTRRLDRAGSFDVTTKRLHERDAYKEFPEEALDLRTRRSRAFRC